MYSLEETLDITMQKGQKKIKKSLRSKLILSFIGGALISLGYLAYIRIISSVTESWGNFASLFGQPFFQLA